MGTKNNPGKFDCYANAEPNEPMFILLGRDRTAGSLVRLWAKFRETLGESREKIEEANHCADVMDAWARTKGKVPMEVGGDVSTIRAEERNKLIRLLRPHVRDIDTIASIAEGNGEVRSSPTFKVIGTSNHDKETMDDLLVCENTSRYHGEKIVAALNAGVTDHSPYFFKLVPSDHELYKYEP